MHDDNYIQGAAAYRRKDYASAIDFLSTSAEAGNADAMYWLATIYAYGKKGHYDAALAFHWYLRAAEDRILDAMFVSQ